MRLRLLVSALSLLLPAAAFASTVVSNTGNTASTGTSLFASYMMNPGGMGMPMPPSQTGSAAASSFTTSNNPLTLESATLLLVGAGPMGNFSVSIFSDNAGAPAFPLTALTSSMAPSGAGEFTYTAATDGYLLTANTTYWLVGQFSTFSPGTSMTWSDTTDLSESSSDGWTMGTKVLQSNGGALNGSWNTDSTRALQFSLNAVPEPGSAALLMLSGGLLFRRSRRAA